MATLRPLKEGSVRTYQEKVALGFPDILASEMDADLDTIYAAWNGTAGGDLQGNYPNPTIIPAARSKWTDTGTLLTPTASAYANKLTLDNGGNLLVGPGTVKSQLSAATDNTTAAWFANNPYAPQDATRNSWAILAQTATSATQLLNFIYRAQNVAAGATSVAMFVDGAGNLTLGGPLLTTGARTGGIQGIRITGSDAGVRCQSAGNDAGDGYGHAIAFGYGTAVVARVNASQMGSVNITPPSDARLKLDVREDVPGLAAVCALRPISFAYDQTKREIGFPPGRYYGLIAQEAEAHVPLVIEDDGSEEHMLGLDYRLLVPVLIRGMQELAARLSALEPRT